MMQLSKEQISQFQNEILTWYSKHQRDLPWRKTRDPYKILLSEIMSQQTQISRVIPKYEAWLKELPTIEDLAKADTKTVLKLWSGLGYNRRALYLQKTAQALMERKGQTRQKGHRRQEKYAGNGRKNSKDQKLQTKDQFWPKTVEELKKLPGFGEYTARAIGCFAFDQQIAVVDTNVRKVILTKFRQNHPERSEESNGFQLQDAPKILSDKELQQIADELLPKGKAYDWNQALMDYSAAVLVSEKIPIVKQSKFKDSNRFYRGKTVRLLLEKKSIAIPELGRLLKKDFTESDNEWLEQIITGLVKDEMIQRTDNTVFI